MGAALVLARPAALLSQAMERSLYVAVVDRSGAPVPGLGPSDFTIREDNVAREVLRVAPADEPMQVAILLSGLSSFGNITQIRQALALFIDGMTPASASDAGHKLAIISQAEHAATIADFTSDRARLQQAVQGTWTQGKNCVLDGVIEVTAALKKREAARPVVVVITTEAPQFCATNNPERVLAPLRESGAAFHALVLGPLSQDTSEDARNLDTVLNEGPKATGGSRDQSLTSQALAAKLQRLADVLTHQYHVTYARPQSFLPPKAVTVGTTRSGLTARGTLIASPRRPS